MAAVEAFNGNKKNPASASTTWINMLQITVAVYRRMEMKMRWERINLRNFHVLLHLRLWSKGDNQPYG